MKFSGYELMWLFFVYSFFGWVIETVAGSVKKRRFVNKGFFTGPFCFIYGFAAVLMAVTLWELQDRWLFLLLGCAIQATLLEWLTGVVLERVSHHKWWDYSGKKFNFDGYICLQNSVLWGILGFMAMKFGNRFAAALYHLIPSVAAHVLMWVLAAVAVIDLTTAIAALLHIQKDIPAVRQWNHAVSRWTYSLGTWLVNHVSRRLVKAYPAAGHKTQKVQIRSRFAQGCGFYKLFWIFMIGSFLGDIAETVFCRLTMGYWMSRSSLVWGPFSIVWGLAMALATALLYKDREKSQVRLFIIGTLLGGAYEYVCSVFTEIVFGKIFWDYSKFAFNLGGRVNLLYCFFWGFAAVLWIKLIYPALSWLIEKIQIRAGKIATWLMVIFMTLNVAVSMMALIRSDGRAKGIEPRNALEHMIDQHFDDERMQQIYPKAKPAVN